MLFAGPRVLIVEDEKEIREPLVEMLEESGYNASAAANGEEALALLRARGAELPAVIIVDLMMPVMNGWELLHELARDPELRRLPIIIMTGSGCAVELPRAEAPVTTLRKPVTCAQLIRVLEELSIGPARSDAS